jgi:hypothetical protein
LGSFVFAILDLFRWMLGARAMNAWLNTDVYEAT